MIYYNFKKMRQKHILFLFLIFGLALPTLGGPEKKFPRDLPDMYRKWLEEEVVYIITPKEKDVFLQLDTNRERDIFIEAFWKIRDPNPNTLENEFKVEHYRRINYSNQWFGRESTKAGWRTDRGRIYIILGPPKDIESYEGQKQLYPVQIWTYPGDPALDLPPQFNVVFYQRDGAGDYVLYSPIRDGPSSLVPGFMGSSYDAVAVYNQLREIEPNVARVSLSLIPGSREQYDPTQRSLASDILISAQIPSSAYKKIETAYAEKLLRYKDVIDVEYTANYIDNDASINVIRDPSGIFFVHYSIEPKKLSLEQYEDRFYSTLELSGRVLDSSDKTIFQYTKLLPIEFNRDQLNKIRTKLFSVQDLFPLIEGHYKFNVLLKNQASKEFTSLEKDIVIPDGSGLQMSSLLLAHTANKGSIHTGKNKPFLVGDVQLVPSSQWNYSLKDNLYLFFQIYGLEEDLKENGFLEYSIFREEKKVHSLIKKINEYPEAPNFIEEIRLIHLSPAFYTIRVSLLDKNKNEILSQQHPFLISLLESLPRPWVLSQVFPPSTDPFYFNSLGNQLFNKEEVAKAIPLLKYSYQKKPESLTYAYDYARALFLTPDFREVKKVLKPFVPTPQKRHDFLALLGMACQKLEEWEEAISYHKQFLARQGTNINSLNAIGECYYQLGKIDEALVAWEKSLEINPQQEEIRKWVDRIKKK
ncbi:MAG: GWxTD domain-containing protein [Candidatus Aminicenantales bacterium]